MNPEIVTLGEPMIEFSSDREGGLCNGGVFHQGFGGDTSNFAVSASRSGGSVGYITQIGADPFGKALMDLWEKERIDTMGVTQIPDHPTGIYFISRSGGRHEFIYYREDSAAAMMTPQMLPVEMIRNAKIFHMSGITQAISKGACETNEKALAVARESGTKTSYDPNLRTNLWDLETARTVIHGTVPKTDVFLPSYDDAVLLAGLENPEEIIEFYLNMGAKTVVLKMGDKGVMLGLGNRVEQFPPYPVDAVYCSGAGDTFSGAFICEYIAGKPVDRCIRFAGAAAALATTRIGCTFAIPTREETNGIMEKFTP